MRWLLPAVFCCSVAAEAQQAPPPVTSPGPVARPERSGNTGAETDAANESGAEARETPEMREGIRPDTPPTAPASPADAEPGQWERLREKQPDLGACLAALDQLGTVFERVDTLIDEDRDCGIANPLRVTEILPGVAIRPAPTLRCDTVRATALWLRDFVQPAAERVGRGPVVALRNGSGYVCRRRNNLPDGKLSEHSFGNALDVMAFEFADGAPIAVEPRERDGTMAEAFQDAVRASACMEFATVLGPGADAYHDDHLHLDVKSRNGGFRLCQ